MIEEYSQGKHYLYRHIRLDTNQPFYIGIGTIRDKELNSYVSTIGDLCKGKIIDGKAIKKNYRFKYI